MQTPDFFYEQDRTQQRCETFADGACLLRGFALQQDRELTDAITQVLTQAPLRHLQTPGGRTMSVAMSNCGILGWVSDRSGYRYQDYDPQTGRPWPSLPDCFADLAARAAIATGYEPFVPEACLINCYHPGAKLTLHQDKDELDLSAPVISVSLGVQATFLFGGNSRSDRTMKIPVFHGDTVVWGGRSRLAFHGIAILKHDHHPLTGNQRYNLTFRKVYRE